jgi:hypothetical protein
MLLKISQNSINKIAGAISKIAPNPLSNTLSKAKKLHAVQPITARTEHVTANQVAANTKNLSTMVDKRLIAG